MRILAEKLKASWASPLPVELCRTVAGFLVRECAVVTAQALARIGGGADSVVDLSREVCVRYVMIDGIRYISSLRNSSCSATDAGETLLIDVQNASNFRDIHIGEDHLGIREVKVSSCGTNASKSDLRTVGLWWRRLSESCDNTTVRTRSDVG